MSQRATAISESCTELGQTDAWHALHPNDKEIPFNQLFTKQATESTFF